MVEVTSLSDWEMFFFFFQIHNVALKSMLYFLSCIAKEKDLKIACTIIFNHYHMLKKAYGNMK